MLIIPTISCVEELPASRGLDPNVLGAIIRCYSYPLITIPPPKPLQPERKLAFEAMTLFMRIDSEIREARADWNQDRFRRLMRLRLRAVSRLRRRWASLNPMPRIPLGHLRRRYHANVGGYLYGRR